MSAFEDKWPEIRKQGKRAYVFRTGVLFWGIPMFVVMTFFVNRPEDGNYTVVAVGAQLVVWLLAGALFGVITWAFQEKKHKAKHRDESSEP